MSSSDEASPHYQHEYTEWGFERLEEVSRTFALSIQYLPAPMKTYVSTSYLLCRIPDTIEDEPNLSPEEKIRGLRAFQEIVQAKRSVSEFVEIMYEITDDIDVTGNPDWNLVFETEKVFELWHSFPESIQSAMRPWVAELTYGMELFINRYESEGGVRIQSMSELEEYCYYVAGTVGHLLTDVTIAEYGTDVTGEIHTASEKYGLVLQLINIAKDVYDDYEEEDNIYLPINELSSVGVSTSMITNASNTDSVGRVVVDVVEQAEFYESEAQEFLTWVRTAQDEVFESFAIPYLLAVATIRELKQNSDMAIDPGEVKIDREEVMNIVSSITQESIPPIDELANQIRAGEFK